MKDVSVIEERCMRWRALRIYVHEWRDNSREWPKAKSDWVKRAWQQERAVGRFDWAGKRSVGWKFIIGPTVLVSLGCWHVQYG